MNAVTLYRRRECDVGQVVTIGTSSISPDPSKPLENFAGESLARLADSIRCHGILQPLLVREDNERTEGCPPSGDLLLSSDAASDKRYRLICGHRRLSAAVMLGLESVDCLVIGGDTRAALLWCVRSETLDMFAQAAAVASLIEVFSLTQEQAAKQLESSQSYVANKLRLLRFTLPERELILTNGLTERHARTLLRLRTPEIRTKAIEAISLRRLNVADSEVLVDSYMNTDRPPSRRLIIRDKRMLCSTIDRALETVRTAGFDVSTVRRETSDGMEVVIRVK